MHLRDCHMVLHELVQEQAQADDCEQPRNLRLSLADIED